MSLTRSRTSIISIIVGSGILVFIAGALYDKTFNSPHLDFVIDNVTYGNSTVKSTLTIYNSWGIPASDIQVLVESDVNITSFQLGSDSYENATIQKKDERTLVAKISRLNPNSNFPFSPLEPQYPVSIDIVTESPYGFFIYTVKATFNEGSGPVILYTVSEERGIGRGDVGLFWYTLVLYPFVAIGIGLALIAFLFSRIIRLLISVFSHRSKESFAKAIRKEAEFIERTISGDPLYRRELTSKTWYDKTASGRKKRISDEGHYNAINQFYESIEQRNFDLRNHNLTAEQLKKHNTSCMENAKQILSNICWEKYFSP